MAAEERTVSEQWLTPGVRGIGAASLLSDLGHEVPSALLPRFITSLGGSAAALGVIEGIADGLAGVARLVGGALADDPHRRRATAVGGYTSVAVLSGLIGAATSVWQVAVLRAGAWTARGLRVPSHNALLRQVSITLHDSSSVTGNTADADDTNDGTGGGIFRTCKSALAGAVGGGNVNDNHLGSAAPVENNIVVGPC